MRDINRPARITITRTVESKEDYGDIVRYWVGGIAVMKDPENCWGAYPGGTWAERPLFTKSTLEECLDMVAGAVALMQPEKG